MDLKSLSVFMQTSLTYECTVCKLYFGNEDQLLNHHKALHSKRLKVSLNPELNLSEDSGYKVSDLDLSTSKTSRSKNDISQQVDTDDYSIAKLEGGNSSTSNDSQGSHDANLEATQQERQSFEKTKSLKRIHDACRKGEEPALKQSKTETDRENKVIGNDNDAPIAASTSYSHQYSDSTEETIKQGQYGYLTDTGGFRRFSLDELKKFAVQVVALFKLDESQQNMQTQSIPVIQNDVTAHSMPIVFQQENLPCSCNTNNSKTAMKQPLNTIGDAVSVDSAINAPDDPGDKSCYKCGQSGHFAWGCTNPRNREIQPRRKRLSRRRKKGSTTEASNVAS